MTNPLARTVLRLLALLVLALAALAPAARAELYFDGKNRFVMEGVRMRLPITNQAVHPALLEISLDWGDEASQAPLPLALSRPLLKLLAGQQAHVDVFYQGEGLPTDRESYLLLRILDVPQAPHADNTMQLALRHHFKLFYRPPLPTTREQAWASLSWERSGDGDTPVLLARNPSPYYLTLGHLEILDASGQPCGDPREHLMIAPYSSQPLPAPGCHAAQLRYQLISDAGNPHARVFTLSTSGHDATASRPALPEKQP